jgi:DNA-binding NarL/FixJ family response regulator
VNTVAAGRSYFSRRFRDLIVREGRKPAAMGKILSRREQQVLFYVLGRKSNKEIAELMELSARTVEFHRANLMAKLEATNIQELTEAARRHGWE